MFKNFALVFILICCLPFATYPIQTNNVLFEEINGTYTFYTSTSVSSEFISVDSKRANQVKSTVKNLCGESVCFDLDNEIIQKTIKKYNAKKVFCEQGEGFYSEYYYTSKLPFYQLIGGLKVNIQVAKSSKTAVIGSPIIYGSF